MRKQILSLLAAMLLVIGMVSAATYTAIDIHTDGTSAVQTFAQVDGYDYGVGLRETGFVQTNFGNTGKTTFSQQITQFGNGKEWPCGEAIGEWSMLETQSLEGKGDTTYNKHFEVWTVRTPYDTKYDIL